MNKNKETLMKFISAQNQKVQDDISKQGYKDNSPYRDNPFNIIQGTPQGTPITMDGVSKRLYATDGKIGKILEPNSGTHFFSGPQVKEIALAKYGGLLNKTIKCSNCGWSWKAADGGNDVSTCHKCGNENIIMQNGGPTSDVKSWYTQQIQSPVYRRNLENSGYKDVDAEIAKRLYNIDKTKYIVDENRRGTYYNPGSRYIHHSPLKDIENWDDNAPESEYILAHEFGHSGVAKGPGTRLNKYDIDQLGSRNKNKTSYPQENYADLKAAQYEAAKLGIYNPSTEEFTQEHLDQLKKNGNIDRLFENYDDKDIIWLQNNLAQVDNQSPLPIAQFGKQQKLTSKDSVAHQADKILKYEQLRGGPGGIPLPQYADPQYMEMLMNKVYPEVQKIMPKASAMETGEAMDFIFNAGWDKNNNKITKDPRAFALQEYYRKYDKSKLDKDGKWAGRKNAAYSFDDEYANTIGKLSENERRLLMNKGRDWYYKNINNPSPGVPSSDYNDTWYGRIWNTNDYNQFNPNNPKFIPKKQMGGAGMMYADRNYQVGGQKKPIYVESKNDPRYKAYQDSLSLYKTSLKNMWAEKNKSKSKVTKKGFIPFDDFDTFVLGSNLEYNDENRYPGENFEASKKKSTVVSKTKLNNLIKNNIKPIGFDINEWKRDIKGKPVLNYSTVYKKPEQEVIVQRPQVLGIDNQLQPMSNTFAMPNIPIPARAPRYYDVEDIVNNGKSQTNYQWYPGNNEALRQLSEESGDRRTMVPRYQVGGESMYTVSGQSVIIPSQASYPLSYKDRGDRDADGTLFSAAKTVSRFDANGKPLPTMQIRENQKIWNDQKEAYGPDQQSFNIWKNNPENTQQGYYNPQEYYDLVKKLGKRPDVGLEGLEIGKANKKCDTKGSCTTGDTMGGDSLKDNNRYGGLVSYQTAGQVKKWLGNTLTPEGYITSTTKGGNYISFTGDVRADDWINKQIDSGKFGFDPKTGGTFPLKKPVKGLSKKDQFIGSDTYFNLRAPEGFNTESQRAQIKNLPDWQQDIVNAENEKRRKRVVKDSMDEVYKSPLWYTPGVIATGGLGLLGLEAAGAAAAPYVTGALATQLPGMAAVPGATVGNAITAGFATHGLTHVGPDTVKMYKNPSWSNFGNLAMDTVEIFPIAGPAVKIMGEGLSATKRALTVEQSAIAKLDDIRNIGPKLEAEIASLKQQEILAEESRKALYADYKAGKITAEQYSAGAKQLNPNELLESRNVLEKQLKEHNIKQEIANTPQQNILKSENQLGKDISDGGNNTKGVFELGDDYVARLSAYGYDDSSRLVNYADKIKSPRTAKTLQVKEIDGKVYQVQNKVTGTPVPKMSEQELRNVPQEHIDNFWKDKAELDELGLSIDISGSKSNVYYDPKKGFQIIDLGIGKSPTNQVISDTYKGLSLPSELEPALGRYDHISSVNKNLIYQLDEEGNAIPFNKETGKSLQDEHIEELKAYYESDEFKRIMRDEYPDVNVELYKKNTLDNLKNKLTYSVENTPEDAIGAYHPARSSETIYMPGHTPTFKQKVENANTLFPEMYNRPGTNRKSFVTDISATSHELDHQRTNANELLPEYLTKDYLKQNIKPEFVDEIANNPKHVFNTYYSKPTEFDVRVKQLKRDLKREGINDYFVAPMEETHVDMLTQEYLRALQELEGNAAFKRVNAEYRQAKNNNATDSELEQIKNKFYTNAKEINDKYTFKNISKDTEDLLKYFNPSFLVKEANRLPAIVPIGLTGATGAAVLPTEKKGGVIGTKQKKALSWINS